MTPKNQTPLTDAAEQKCYLQSGGTLNGYVRADFARALEAKLTAQTAAAQAMEAALEIATDSLTRELERSKHTDFIVGNGGSALTRRLGNTLTQIAALAQAKEAK